jgi:hypothetical protein
MRLYKFFSLVVLGVLAFSLVASAADKNLGIAEHQRITFSQPVRLGGNLLQAGDYSIRHEMVGDEHIMIFKRAGGKEEFKVKCTLVKLNEKANQTRTTLEMNAANERVVTEIVFRGDTAKHVFANE